MSSFRIVEQSFEGQHIREYPKAIATHQEDVLRIKIKQYVPLDAIPHQPGDITIIAAHANGFPKELYEPLWDDLLAQSKNAGFTIRSIWMADYAHQGESYLLNEDRIGVDPNFVDHARDLNTMINQFRNEFTRPIIGIGHSMGASSLASLAYMHPRLLASLIMIDPVIPWELPPSFYPLVRMISGRKDLWPSHSAAKAAFLKSPIVKNFDPRVIDKVLAHSIRPTPTLLYPESPQPGQEQPYTLTTPKHQEAASLVRPNYADAGVLADTMEARQTHPDIIERSFKSPFYKSEGKVVWDNLPQLRPSVFWLYGAESNSAAPEERDMKMQRTGTGFSGSGGASMGRVKESLVPGTGHFVCLEKVEESAGHIARFLEYEMAVWRKSEECVVDGEWKEKDLLQRQMLDQRWYENVEGWKGQRKVEERKVASKL